MTRKRRKAWRREGVKVSVKEGKVEKE